MAVWQTLCCPHTGSLLSGGGRAGSLAGNWKVPFDLGFGNSEASVQQIWAGPGGQGWGAVACSHGGNRSQHDGMICAESDREHPRLTPGKVGLYV